jgi:flavorubredoxin
MFQFTRRHFIKSSTLLTANVALTGMHGCIAKAGWGAQNEFLQTSCGEEKQAAKKVLIAYASMHGSTGEVAGALAKDLCAAGASVDIRLVGTVRDLSPYQAVVVGSAILFAGVLDYNKYGAAIKAVMKYKMWAKGVEEGDHRDWQAIHAWANQLKAAFLSA